MPLYNSAGMAKDTTMNRDDIIARTIYVMWHEERLWNVGVLQGVHFSNPVLEKSNKAAYKN
jgi:hypothetical protein